jgi:hypothetical protein
MRLSVFLYFEDGADKALDHGFVIDEASVYSAVFCLDGRVEAVLDVGIVEGITLLIHSNYMLYIHHIIIIARP